jgi:DNA-binding SARP family transcriptional activator
MGTRRHVVARLATDALERGELELAVDLADELRHYDGGDETAYELMIRAYLSSGNTASALREYRNYREHLMHALGIEPPYSMEELTGRTPRQQTG